MTKEQNSSWKKIVTWLLTIACLVGIPAALLSVSTIRYYSVIEEELQFDLKMKLQQATNDAIRNISQEEFWCRLFFEKINEFRSAKTCIEDIIVWLKQQKALFPDDIDFIVWEPGGKQLSMSFISEYSTEEWHEVISIISSNGGLGAPSKNFGKADAKMEIARKVLGPQFLHAIFFGINNPAGFSFGWTDSSGKKPPIAPYFVPDGGILILFNQEGLKHNSGLRYSLKQFSHDKNISYGIYNTSGAQKNKIWLTNAQFGEEILEKALIECETKSLSFNRLQNHYVGFHYLTPDLRIFACRPRHLADSQIFLRAGAVAFAYIFFMLPFLSYTWKTGVNSQPGKVSIRYKLAFLFLFANGIPLLAMIIISQEHYSQKRHTLIAEAHQSSIDLLLSIDRRFLSAVNSNSTRLDKFFTSWGTSVAGKVYSEAMNNEIASYLTTIEPSDYFMVSSHSKAIGGKAGYFTYRGELDNASIDLENSRPNREVSEIIRSDLISANLVGKKVMSDLNRVELSGQTLSKLEIVAESVLQKSFIEITHSIISNIGRINQWGFGQIKDLTYFKFISVADTTVTDYLAMVFWRPMIIQSSFLKKAIPEASKNGKGFKLFARNRLSNSFVSETGTTDQKLHEFAQRLGAKPTEEIELLSLNGEDFIALGFNGQHLDLFQIILLYPVKTIEQSIGRQKTDLLLLGLFSLLLAAGLAQILSRSFVEPLATLREGALAIENRNFSHRITTPGRDEFGEVAGIFNGVMVGFEELEVARIVQESLFPSPSFNQGRCRIYGKSICMSELGGDYLDFFKIDDNHVAVLMGDVAGHGVGAALIMAMAKAGILSSGTLLSAPKSLLLGLHKMILASKSSRQKKVMTFQYLYLNSDSCTGAYSNAGGCSPMIFRRNTGKVEEIPLAGAALGAFKKAVYNELDLAMEPGDAMIFYTDGIVESRDQNGLEIGYDGFAAMLKQAYNEDPQIYYNELFALYTSHIGTQSAQDDLTLIILVCT